MAFPVSPVNGQQANINGITYTYSNTLTAWTVSTSVSNSFVSISVTGNVTSGNILNSGLISSTGNITGGNLSGTSIVGTLTTAAQTNITSVGTLGSLAVTGNITGGNVTTTGIVSATGNVTGNYLIGNGSQLTGVISSASNTTWTGTQTFNGSSSIFGTVLLDSAETVNVVSAAPSSTTNFYVQSGSVQYYNSNAANNWTLNIAFSSGTSMNTALAVGQSVTFALVTTQGSTAYYNSAVTIDGTSVTPKWIGGAPTAGNASGLDVYRYAVIKTASATYTVLASLTQFK
jgi:hypothetical protein